jgi:hypothetical protein
MEDPLLMPLPSLKYLMNTPVNELVQASLIHEPELRNTAPYITEKLMKWARENNLSSQAVTVALIHWLAMGTEEGQKDSQV